MREMKFRAWDKDNFEMLFSEEVTDDVIWEFVSGNIKVSVKKIGSEEIFWSLEEMPIMQFTGLLDKNGKEIYEGDILHFKNLSGNEVLLEVKWFKYKWVFEKILNGQNIKKGGLFGFSNPDLFEVIGNIYENPELLNSNK